MSTDTFPHRVNDLARFGRIAEMVQQGHSLRDIAADLKLSNSSISETIERLERHWDCVLLTKTERSGLSNVLTVEGQRIYQQLRQLVRDGGRSTDSRVSIHISHSLLTSQLLAPVVSRYLDRLRSESRTEMTFQSERNFDQVVFELQQHRLDLSVTWTNAIERVVSVQGVELHPCGPPIPLVVISHDPAIVKRIVSVDAFNPHATENLRLVRLSHDRQPHPTGCDPTWIDIPRSLQVDSFDTIIAFVRSRMADFGIVPVICGDLDRLVSTQELFYAKLPGSSIKLALCTRKGGRQSLPPEARQFVGQIERQLLIAVDQLYYDEDCCEVGDHSQGRSAFPNLPDWYLDMRFGYFIDKDRRRNLPAEWKWEEVCFCCTNRHSAEGGNKDSGGADVQPPVEFDGYIRNADGALFKTLRASLVGNMFYVASKKENKDTITVDSFVSVFYQCFKVPGVMLGFWVGLDIQERPLLCATIFSHNQLTKDEVIRYARQASASTILNSLFTDYFERQPETKFRSELHLNRYTS